MGDSAGAGRAAPGPVSPESISPAPYSHLTARCQAAKVGLSAGNREDVVPGPRKAPPFYRLFPVFPTCQNALESRGRAGATYRARLVLLASRIAHSRYVCNSPAAANVVF